jgi:hypothetical protein
MISRRRPLRSIARRLPTRVTIQFGGSIRDPRWDPHPRNRFASSGVGDVTRGGGLLRTGRRLGVGQALTVADDRLIEFPGQFHGFRVATARQGIHHPLDITLLRGPGRHLLQPVLLFGQRALRLSMREARRVRDEGHELFVQNLLPTPLAGEVSLPATGNAVRA